ncbi:MAG TPA: alkaline phosphatase family protein [Candidatus Cybelea sp.]
MIFPASGPPPGLSKIDHIVIVVQENRSFDNLFSGFPGARSATEGRLPNGKRIRLGKVSLAAPYDISHGRQDAVTAVDRGHMDGFALEYSTGASSGNPYPQYAVVEKSQIAPYWTLARQYVLSDETFASQLDGSFVAHQFLIAGWAGQTYNYPSAMPWGCDSPSVNRVGVLDGAGHPAGLLFPCFSYRTIASELDAAGLSWRYYAPHSGPGGLWSAFDAIEAIRHGPDWHKNVISPETRVLDDAKTGQLPSVAWVVPSNPLSDHPGSGSDRGPSWVASVVNAIGEGPDWKTTAIFVTWDDWGGWYDDVPPPHGDAFGPGIRVPLLCISPYAKAGYVDHERLEFASLLRLIEERFALRSLGRTDLSASAPLGCFDFTSKPRAFKRIDALYREVDVRGHANGEAPDDQ